MRTSTLVYVGLAFGLGGVATVIPPYEPPSPPAPTPPLVAVWEHPELGTVPCFNAGPGLISCEGDGAWA